MPVWDTLNDLKDVLHGDTARHGTTSSGNPDHSLPQGAQEQNKDHGISSKIKDVISAVDGGKREEESRLRVEKEKEEAKKNVESGRGWTGKVHDALDGGKHRSELEEAEFQRVHQEAQKERNKDASLADRLKDVILDDESTGISDKLHTLTGVPPKEEKKQPDRGWLSEKLNELAGGGKKSEANEDKLDKAIDFVQEHFLNQGDQSNESALEQLKDEQISNAIRGVFKSVTGHEMPVKDK